MKDKLPYIRELTGIATAIAIGLASEQSAQKTDAQTPPVSGGQNNVLLIPYIPPFEKYASIFPPSTPTLPEKFYASPKVTSLMDSCNDGTAGRKVTDVEASISPLENSFFPGPGFRYLAVALKKEDLSKNTNGSTKKYAQFNMNGYRKMVIKFDFSNASENPLTPMQKGQEYFIAIDQPGPNGQPSFEGAEVTIFKAVGCPPKN